MSKASAEVMGRAVGRREKLREDYKPPSLLCRRHPHIVIERLTILSALYTFAGDYSFGGSCRHPKVLCSFVSRWVDEAGGGMINWEKT